MKKTNIFIVFLSDPAVALRRPVLAGMVHTARGLKVAHSWITTLTQTSNILTVIKFCQTETFL